MKTFSVYVHPHGEDIQAVKNGWSWPAFFLDGFWALYKNLPLPAAIGLILFFISFFINPLTCILISLVLSIVFGLQGNEWVKEKLKKQGYVYKESIPAEYADTAILKYQSVINKKQQKAACTENPANSPEPEKDPACAAKPEIVQDEISEEANIPQSDDEDDFKTCPYCAEKIRKAAVLCRYCHSKL